MSKVATRPVTGHLQFPVSLATQGTCTKFTAKHKAAIGKYTVLHTHGDVS